jgi:sigma-B regulation protein RsbU (phosphoserine phosphatase)
LKPTRQSKAPSPASADSDPPRGRKPRRLNSARDHEAAEFLRTLDSQLKELAERAADLAQSLRAKQPDSDMATLFLAISREALRGSTVLDLLREAERERYENQTLMQISMKLSGSTGIEDVLRTILDSLKQVVNFSAAGIFIYNRDLGQVDVDMLSGYDGADREAINLKFQKGVRLGQGIVGSVIQSGHPIYVPDTEHDTRYIVVRSSTRSELAVPIIVTDEVIGVFNLESDDSDAFDERDLRILTTFANHAGVALERARNDRLRQHSRRIEEEISLARKIQTTFLPRTTPDFAPFDLAGCNYPSSEVGGDYFDFIPITETDLGVVISDVTGHGFGAALLMAGFRACLRIESRNNFAVRTILAKVNDYLYETNPPGNYVTAVYGVLDRRNHVFSYSNAGHNWPVLIRPDDTIQYLDTGGLLLGAYPAVQYEETHVKLDRGDILVFFTDGVTEARDAEGREFGLARLEDLVKSYRHLSSKEIAEKISVEVRNYQAESSPPDDLTLTIIKHV